jgi:Arm DNA-binding domain
MARWTQDRDVPKLRYQSSLDPKGRRWHYLWEAAGFGAQVFKNGKCTWVQCGSRKDTQSGKWKSYFYALGDVAVVKLADARAEAGRVKADAKQSIDVRVLEDAQWTEQKAEATLAATSLQDVLQYYLDNRNCAPSSKSTLASILSKHLADWMSLPILNIDATMLQGRYKKVIAKVEADGVARTKRYTRLAAADRLVYSSDGYFTGIKTGHDVVEGFGRIYRYWITKHLIKLQRAGVLVPA